MAKIRRQYHFYGRVQGVGFRYTARHAAAALGLTGWVRNEYDGSVTMEAQGSKTSLDLLLSMIEDGHYIRIDHAEVREIPIDESERGFFVRH